MKQRVRFIVALLLMAVQGVWAWEGSGTSTDPYLIQNLDEWKSLSYDLAHQKSHGGKGNQRHEGDDDFHHLE